MHMPNKSDFLQHATLELSHLYDELSSLETVQLSSFDAAKTALIIVDMVNGFASEGPLASPRIGALEHPIAALTAKALKVGMPVVAFADTHTEQSAELHAYPVHCLAETRESEICPAILQAAEQVDNGSFTIIAKNSTNGFMEDAFTSWREQHEGVDTYLIVGDCTDICIVQFALTAKAWHNTHNKPLHIVVPSQLNDTYDSPGHPADLSHSMALAFMRTNGISLCKTME